MMENMLLTALGRACVHGGALALVVWLLAKGMRRVPLSLQRWGWWLVCAKTLLAFTGWVWISLPLLPADTEWKPAEPYEPYRLAHEQRAELPATPSITQATSPVASPPIQGQPLMLADYAPAALAWLWVAMVVALFVGMGRRWAQIERRWREARPLDDARWRAHVHRLCVQMELPSVPQVRLSEGDHPPMALIGNRVLIAERLWEQLSDEERTTVLAHEFAHLQRGDAWWSLVPMLAQVLFFFFPPIRYAMRQWELGCEVASDAIAMRVAECTPYAYGSLLLKIAERMRPVATPLGAGTTHNFRHLRTRLQQLTPARLTTAWLSVLTLGLVALLALPWQVTAQVKTPKKDALVRQLRALAGADWREAFRVGLQLASLPPDTGYALLKQHWNRLPVHARRQMLKAFYYTLPYPLSPRMHPKLVPVLELGATDRSPSVRDWVKTYLQDLALREFRDTESLRAWFAQYRNLPAAQVVRAHWEPFLRDLPKLPPAEREARLMRLAESFVWLREPTVVRPLAARYRLHAVLAETLYANRMDASKLRLLEHVLRCLLTLSRSEQELRPAVAPLLDPQQPCATAVRALTVDILSDSQCAWVTPQLIALAQHAVKQPVEPELWMELAEAFCRLEVKQALPTLRAMRARAKSPTLRENIKRAIMELERL